MRRIYNGLFAMLYWMTSKDTSQVTRQRDRRSNTGRGAIGRDGASGTRRRRMLEWMRGRSGPVAGTELARHFRVSRQCVVQDIAILRAERNDILSTPQGYRLPAKHTPDTHRAVVACQHGAERTEEEIGRASVGKECRSRWSPVH